MPTLHLSDDPEHFARLALEVQQVLGGELGECIHGLDQSYWDLTVGDCVLTVHREHYSGVMLLYPDESRALAFIERYRAVLQQRT